MDKTKTKAGSRTRSSGPAPPVPKELKPREVTASRRKLIRQIAISGYVAVNRYPPGDMVGEIRKGLPATFLTTIAKDMEVSKESVYEVLRLPRTTFIRKAKKNERMNPEETERVLELAKLIGQVEEMVERSGDATGFSAAKWTAAWLQKPNAALGGKRPAEWMDTATGRKLVSDTIARLESGAYS